MTIQAKIEEALKLLNLNHKLNNLVLITPPGVGTIYALTRLKGLPMICCSEHSEFPTELVEEAYKTSDIVVFDEAYRTPLYTTLKFREFFYYNTRKTIVIARNYNDVPGHIMERSLSYDISLH